MAKKRIFVNVTDNQLKVIEKLRNQENRSQSYIATMIFNDGFKLVEKNEIGISGDGFIEFQERLKNHPFYKEKNK
ncbi:MAG: hypothetical protein WC380_00225 [Pedobacter sp.]|jgi:hypothetical protein